MQLCTAAQQTLKLCSGKEASSSLRWSATINLAAAQFSANKRQPLHTYNTA
jgi:hypothetical protein